MIKKKNKNILPVIIIILLLVISIVSMDGCDVIFEQNQSPLAITTTETNNSSLKQTIDTSSNHQDTTEKENITTDTINLNELPPILNMTENRKTALNYLDELTNSDYGGQQVMITTTNNDYDSNDINTENNKTNIIDTEKAAETWRDDVINKKYNIKITYNYVPGDQLNEKTTTEYQSFNYFSNFIIATNNQIAQLAINGLLLNLNKIPFINFSEPYYCDNSNKGINNGGIKYSISGDAVINPEAMWAIYYNNNIIKENNLADPIELYNKNSWNIDNLIEMAKQTTKDINNDGKLLNQDDLFGFGIYGNTDDFINVLLQSGEYDIINSDDGSAKIDLNKNSYNNNLINKIESIISNSDMSKPLMNMDSNYTPDIAKEAFQNNRLLFYTAPLNQIKNINAEGLSWSIINCPKMDSNQNEYYTAASNDIYSVCVYAGDKDTELSGKIIQAYFAASYKHIIDEYINTMQINYMQNTESSLMLNNIINNTYFNLLYMFSDQSKILNDDIFIPIYKYITKKVDYIDEINKKENEINKYFSDLYKLCN